MAWVRSLVDLEELPQPRTRRAVKEAVTPAGSGDPRPVCDLLPDSENNSHPDVRWGANAGWLALPLGPAPLHQPQNGWQDANAQAPSSPGRDSGRGPSRLRGSGSISGAFGSSASSPAPKTSSGLSPASSRSNPLASIVSP